VLRRLFQRRIQAAATEAELALGTLVIVDEAALFFGVRSRGVAQVRGNGYLAASEHALFFRMWVGKRKLQIPRDRMTGVSTPRSFLGKTAGQTLLAISFTNDESQLDEAAWLVRDLSAWQATLGQGPVECSP
jgi:hypothetical protein